MLNWLATNWGNVASVVGLALAVPSLIISLWAWKEARRAEQAVFRANLQWRLQAAKDSLLIALRLCNQLRTSKAAKWPLANRTALRDELLKARWAVEWCEDLQIRLGRVVVELHHEIVRAKVAEDYLESIIDLIVECKNQVEMRLTEVSK